MKKLLNILSAVGILLSSSVTAVSCAGKDKGGSDSDNTMVDNIVTATGDISKMLLVAKSENLGLNAYDALSSSAQENASMNYLARFNNAKNNSTISSNSDLRQLETNHVLNWENAFGTRLDKMNNSTANALDFIDSDSLSKENNDNNLNYLLSGETRNAFDGTDANYYTPNLGGDEAESTAKLMQAAQKGSSSSNALISILKKFTTDQVNDLITIINNIMPMAATKTQSSSDKGDDNTSPGNLKQAITGSGNSMGISGVFTLNNGEKTGFIPYVLEKVFMVYKKYQVDNNNKSDLLTELIGNSTEKKDTEDGYQLIIKAFGGDTTKYDENAADCPGNSATNVWFSAQDDTGLFGQVINDMGRLKFHLQGASDDIKNNYLSTSEAMGQYDTHNFIFMDQDMQLLMKDTVKLFEVAKASIPEEIIDQGLKEAVKNLPFALKNTIIKGQLGIDLNSDPEIGGIFMNMLVDVTKSFFAYKNDVNYGDDKEYVDAAIADSNFSSELVDGLKSATKEIKADKWMADENIDYRNAVFTAMGVDGEEFKKDSFLSDFKDVVQKYGDKLTDKIDSLKSENWLMENIDANVIDPKKWITSNVISESDEFGDVTKVTYTIEYKGLGSKTVSDNKVQFAADNYTQDTIYQKLVSNDSDFKSQYLGDGMFSNLDNVDHKYTVTWINKMDDNDSTSDFYLANISDSLMLDSNGEWKVMSI